MLFGETGFRKMIFLHRTRVFRLTWPEFLRLDTFDRVLGQDSLDASVKFDIHFFNHNIISFLLTERERPGQLVQTI